MKTKIIFLKGIVAMPLILTALNICFPGQIITYNLLHPIQNLLSFVNTEGGGMLFGSNTVFLGVILILTVVYLFLMIKYIEMLLKSLKIDFFEKKSIRKKIINFKRMELKQNFSIGNLLEYFYFTLNILNKKQEIKNEEVVFWKIKYNLKNKFYRLNEIIKGKLKNNTYIKDFKKIDNIGYSIQVYMGGYTLDEFMKKFLEFKNEIIRVFTKQESIMNIKTTTADYKTVELFVYFEKNLWKNQKFEFSNIKINKFDVLCGFFLIVKINHGVEIKKYIISLKDIFSAFIVGATRSGKNIFMNNLIFSILENIRLFKNIEMVVFDTKGSDFNYLEGLENHGIFRYSKISDFVHQIKELKNEMLFTQELIGEHSNIDTFSSNNGKLKEKVIIINEFASIINELKGKILNEFISDLNILLSQGLSAGYRVFILSQSMRKDINSSMGEVLINIGTRFVLQSFSVDESIISGKGVSAEKVKNLERHHVLHINHMDILQEFKPFLIEQSDLKSYIENNFSNEKKDTIIGISNLDNYIAYSQKKGKLSMKEAKNKFGIKRTEWDKMISVLKDKNLIEKLPNNTIIWKK